MKSISDNQLAANRTNAARSTGPRTPEGKARAAQNARRHGLAASTYAASPVEDAEELEYLIADAGAFYEPRNSQERIAVERIALSQLAMFRAARLEGGALSACFSTGARSQPVHMMASDATLDQKNSHTLAEGFLIQSRDGRLWTLLLRYQAQAERQYRRAVEELDRLRRVSPNEPISTAQPEETTPDAFAPNEPIPPSGLEMETHAEHDEAVVGGAVQASPRDLVPVFGPEAHQPSQPQIHAASEPDCAGRPSPDSVRNAAAAHLAEDPGERSDSASRGGIEGNPRGRRELPPHARGEEDRVPHRAGHRSRRDGRPDTARDHQRQLQVQSARHRFVQLDRIVDLPAAVHPREDGSRRASRDAAVRHR
jgi:hypothetical protein